MKITKEQIELLYEATKNLKDNDEIILDFYSFYDNEIESIDFDCWENNKLKYTIISLEKIKRQLTNKPGCDKI